MTLLPSTPQGAQVAPLIDHTLLKPDATGEQVSQLCREARHYGFAAVCVNPAWLEQVVQELDGSPVKPCVVLDFPLGACPTSIKELEARAYVKLGAAELDMVMAVGALKEGRHTFVRDDIRAVVNAAEGRTIKVILETVLLSDDEKVTACKLAADAGAHFVKTSTGFAGGGATAEDICLMRETVGRHCGVKASGGIRKLEDAVAMIAAGANRIGASAGVAIVTQLAK